MQVLPPLLADLEPIDLFLHDSDHTYENMSAEFDLAWRHERVNGISADVVREGDHFVWAKGLVPMLEHRPSDAPNREERPITHAYAIIRIKGGEPVWDVLSFLQIEARRKRGGNRSFSPWKTDYAEMAKKTVLRTAMKYAPQSVEVQRASSLESVGYDAAKMTDVVDDKVRTLLAENLLPLPGDATEDATPARGAKAALSAAKAKQRKRAKPEPAKEPKPEPDPDPAGEGPPPEYESREPGEEG